MTPALRLGTIVGVIALSLAITLVRFCGGDVPMPPKPPPPESSNDTSGEVLEHVAASSESWQQFVAHDATSAGIATPTPAAMARKLIDRADEKPTVIAPGESSYDVAGLRLTAGAVDDEDNRQLLVLTIENLTDHDLAYLVVTEPRPSSGGCNTRTILDYDAMVVRRGGKVVRSECGYRPGMSLLVERVETLELEPLMSLYVSSVPPAAVGADARLSRGHHPDLPSGWAVCSTVASQAVRSAIERGEISWRDLIDFYARHRCSTYSFPQGYRAFERDGARSLPAVEP